jgi:hypothetical protein
VRGRGPTEATGRSVVIGVHTRGVLVRARLRRRAARDGGTRGPTTRSRSTTTARSGAPSTTATGRRSTSSTPEGIIRDQHFGEGRYEQSERVILRLLSVEREPVSVEGVGPEAEADWDHLRTPETYLGYARGERSVSPDRLGLNDWAGEWTIGPENVVLDQAGGNIAFRFQARDAHLVLSPGAMVDPLPRAARRRLPAGLSHGVDVDEDGNALLQDDRMYQLVRERDAVCERTLKITFLEPGAEAYAFTFG